MRFAKGLSAVLALALVIGWSGRAGAMVPEMTLAEMSGASQSIVYGRVLSLVPHWDADHRTIQTTVTFEPIQFMKGVPGASPITFEMPGGTVGDTTLVVEDVPEFKVGEEAVLFLRPEYFRVVGWYQGKLGVEDGVVLGQNMALDEFHLRIAELGGLLGAGGGVTTSDGAVMRRATLQAPPSAGGMSPAPESRGNGESAPRGDFSGPDKAPKTEVVIMSEDFEGTFPTGSWSLTDQGGTGHKWGKETFRKHAGTYSMWECAAGASALPSGSDYANNMTTWAIYGPFDLSDATSAELRFWRSVQTASSNDRLFYAASANDSSFSGLFLSVGTGAWLYETLGLGSYLGDGTVWIAFMFQSDASGTNKGVFIDDVELVKTTAGASSPSISSLVPNNGPSGTDLAVTINGSNFGATQGGSRVTFVFDAQGPITASAPITSWSDTQITCTVPDSACSGTVNVVVGGDPGTGQAFTVSYRASSTWWHGSEPMGEDLLINPNTADVPAADALAACIKGFQEWNAESGGDFSYTYGGPTSVTAYVLDGINEVAWGTTSGSLATNYSWFVGSIMQENDIIFDDVWNWSASGEANKYDIESVFTHESGHCLRLLDLYGTADQGKTMYGRIAKGDIGPRTIEQADKDGLKHFYGAQSLNITTRDLPNATSPVFYSAAITALGGTPPRTFALRSGSTLPAGLSLSSAGVVSGYPQESGTFYFNVRVTDNVSDTDSQVIKLYIDSAAPVVLEEFTATPVDGGILVEWNLASQSDIGEFYLYRSVVDSDGEYKLLSEEPIPASDRPGRGFGYLDADVIDGTLYYYKLEARDWTFFGPVSALASLGRVGVFWLGQNRPNPFAPGAGGGTVMSFSLPAPAHATVRVYDVAGRLVATPLDANVGAGTTDVPWDGTEGDGNVAPSGVYFYELLTDGFHSTRKMTVMR